MQDIRHESLEAHIFNTGDVFGAFKVVRGAILAAFASIVDDCVLVPRWVVEVLFSQCLGGFS